MRCSVAAGVVLPAHALSEAREGGRSACTGRPCRGRRCNVRVRECWDGDSARRALGARSATMVAVCM
eukprot:11251731-Heterocapsa_arctica.AAC.1